MTRTELARRRAARQQREIERRERRERYLMYALVASVPLWGLAFRLFIKIMTWAVCGYWIEGCWWPAIT